MNKALAKQEIQVVTGGDEAFAAGLFVTTSSALERTPATEKLRIHILDGGLSNRSRHQISSACERIRAQVPVHFHNLESFDFSDMTPGHNGSRMYYARLAMAEILRGFDKAIYLDSDTVVLGNLAELWNIELGDKFALACRDRKIGALAEDCPWKLTPEDRTKGYFNSGVLLVNLAAWRKFEVSRSAAKLALTTNSPLKWWDQTLLNFLLRDSIGFLPETWNWQRECRPPDSKEVGVVHFTTPKKPWLYWGSDFRFRLWRDVYRRHFGSPIRLFLKRSRILGLMHGHWDYWAEHHPVFRKLKTSFLRVSLALTRDHERRKSIVKSLEFYDRPSNENLSSL